METIKIGSRKIGPGQPCFLVAEIGINHNGDMDLARKLIDAAVEAGADSVKFQNYRTEEFISDRTLTYEYISQGETIVESQYDMFKRYELTKSNLQELKSYCDSVGTIFHSTPMGKEGIQDLVEIETPILKNGSDCLTHLYLIRAMGNTQLPTVISTGMATLSEIDEAVRTFYATGNTQLILLHCTSSYPTPFEDTHLRKIASMQSVFDCPVGFSDHTPGIYAAIGSIAFGACWIEKHFTLDHNLPGPDHRFSVDPSEFQSLTAGIRAIEKCLGNARIQPTSGEEIGRRDYRLSCVAKYSLDKDHQISEKDIGFCRPGYGIPPHHSYLLLGRTLKHQVEKGDIFKPEDFY